MSIQFIIENIKRVGKSDKMLGLASILSLFRHEFKVVQDPCQKKTECFLKKVRVIFIYCLKTYTYWRSQKYHLSTHLYDQIYFERLVQFHP